MGGNGVEAPVELDPPVGTAEMPRDELLAAEKEALGLYVSSHPLHDCRQQLARATTCGLAALAERADGEAVTVGGLIGVLKSITTRRGEPMMFVRLDDLEGSVEVVVVPAVLAEARELLARRRHGPHLGPGGPEGGGRDQAGRPDHPRVHARGGRRRRSASWCASTPPASPQTPLDDLRRLLVDHAGPAPVVLDVVTDGRRRRLRLGEEFRVNPRDNGLVAELKTLFGERCLA